MRITMPDPDDLRLLSEKTDVGARAKSLVDVPTSALKFQGMVVHPQCLPSDLFKWLSSSSLVRRDAAK